MESSRAARGARPWFVAVTVFGLALGLLFAPALTSSAQFLFRDAGRMHHPVKRLVADALAQGRLAQWNPYDGLGAPLVSDPIHAVQHPFNVFLLLLPFEAGFKAWVLASCLAAAMGAWTFARTLGATPAGGLAAGLAFGLSGFLVSSTDNLTYLTGGAFLPWVLAAGFAFVRGGGRSTLLGLIFASYSCAAAGDPVSWVIALGMGPLLGVLLASEGRRTSLRRALGAFATGLAGGAPILAPLLAWLPGSGRAELIGRTGRGLWNLYPARLLELAIPHLSRDPTGDTGNEVMRVFAGSPPSFGPWALSIYVGVTVLLLAAAGASARAGRALLGVALATAWMAMGPYLGFATLAERLPFLSGVRYWEKLAIWPTLLVCVMAGLGASRLLDGDGAARWLARRGAVLAVALGVVALGAGFLPLARWLATGPDTGAAAGLLAGNLAEGSLHAAILAGLLAAIAWLVGEGRLDRLAPAALLLTVGADLLGVNVRGYRLAEPPGPLPQEALGRRVLSEPGLQAVVTPFALRPVAGIGRSAFESKWLRGARELYPAWNAAQHVRNSFPYSALQPRRYARFDEVHPLERRVAALGTFGFQSMVVAGAPEALRGTALAPPWVVLARDAALDSVLVAIPHRPRAYLASGARSVAPEEALAFAGLPSEAAGMGAVVEAAVPPGIVGGEATVVRDDAEAVTVRTTSAGPSLLVLNDAWAEGWRATVDGRPSPIHPANYAARGVFVESGVHEVAFTYRTPGLALGWAIASTAFALVAALAVVEARRRARGVP